MKIPINYDLTPTDGDRETAADALGSVIDSGAITGWARVIASVRVHAFKQAIQLAMAECDKYIERRKKANAETDDIHVHFRNRDMIQAAGSCKSWIETIKEPA